SSPFEYTTNENEPPILPRPLEMNPPTPPIGEQHKPTKLQYGNNHSRALTPSTGNWGPGIVGIGKARQWGSTGRGNGGGGEGGGGGRVVSRSGVEIRNGGILPNGGVRAREVSGKIMEEGRGSGGGWR
ncbi:MAG: hypothetical protein Q9164_003689, partial [Protoblastenia rupestris]